MVNLKMKLQNKLNSFFPDAIDSEILILGTGTTLRKGMQFVEKTNFLDSIIYEFFLDGFVFFRIIIE